MWFLIPLKRLKKKNVVLIHVGGGSGLEGKTGGGEKNKG